MMYKNYKTKKDYIEATLINNGFAMIECKDDSELHAGHQGHGVESHFSVTLQQKFSTVSERLIAHKKAIGLFVDDIPTAIHALSFNFVL